MMVAATANPDFLKAKSYCFRLLKFRVRSEKEIRDKLKLKGHSVETCDDIVAFLKKAKLIDDALFARVLVQSRLKRPFGLRRICQELRQKGINKEVAEGVLADARAGYDEAVIIREIVKHKLSRMKNLDKEKKKARLFGFLVRRGYSQDLIFDALNDELR